MVHIGTDGNIYSGTTGGALIAIVSHGTDGKSVKGEWGRRIVRAVNCHDELIAACKALLGAINECQGPQGSLAWMRPIAAAQAAIANAEAQP